jgi:hypothetical protein
MIFLILPWRHIVFISRPSTWLLRRAGPEDSSLLRNVLLVVLLDALFGPVMLERLVILLEALSQRRVAFISSGLSVFTPLVRHHTFIFIHMAAFSSLEVAVRVIGSFSRRLTLGDRVRRASVEALLLGWMVGLVHEIRGLEGLSLALRVRRNHFGSADWLLIVVFNLFEHRLVVVQVLVHLGNVQTLGLGRGSSCHRGLHGALVLLTSKNIWILTLNWERLSWSGLEI